MVRVPGTLRDRLFTAKLLKPVAARQVIAMGGPRATARPTARVRGRTGDRYWKVGDEHAMVPMKLRPLGWAGSLLMFGIPTLLYAVSMFIVLPAVLAAGASPFLAFHIAFIPPLVLMLVAAFAAYRMEGRPWTWSGIIRRFRLTRPDRATWLWMAVLPVWLLVSAPLLSSFIAKPLAAITFYEQPARFTRFINGITDGKTHFLGLPFSWALLLYWLVLLFVFTILGEELWWRGVILPRQELAFGRATWLIHGVLWALFHFPFDNNLGSLVTRVILACSLAYVAQRTGSTWPGMIGHSIINLTLPAVILVNLLGGSVSELPDYAAPRSAYGMTATVTATTATNAYVSTRVCRGVPPPGVSGRKHRSMHSP